MSFIMFFDAVIWGKYKTWNGTKHNGTESEVICTIWTWTSDMLWKIGVNMPALSMDEELISCPVPATKTGQADSLEPHKAYETF